MPKRTNISSILVIGAGFTAALSYASTPSGRYFGDWHVVSINSLSGGGEGNDAAAMLVQERNCNPDGNACDDLRIGWQQESSNVGLSVYFSNCEGEDQDFQQSYSVSVDRWKEAGEAIEQRVESDFKAWLGQATLICDKPERAKAFNLRQLRQAVRYFTQRVSLF